jgi:hypothetical protein
MVGDVRHAHPPLTPHSGTRLASIMVHVGACSCHVLVRGQCCCGVGFCSYKVVSFYK